MNHYQKINEREQELRENAAELVRTFRTNGDDKLNQADFAKTIDVSTNALRRVEQQTPDISLTKLASVLVKSYDEYLSHNPSDRSHLKRVLNIVFDVLRM